MSSFIQAGSPLLAPDAGSNHYFSRVALSRDGLVLAVGAYAAATKGQVYVYDLVDEAWEYRSTLTPPGLWDYEFGIGVALDSDGSTLVISGTSFGDYGGVYVYDWSGSAWVKRTQMVVPATEDISGFGWSVALSSNGNILAVGCQWDYTQGGTGSSVWLFDWDGDEWIERGSLYNGDALSYGIAVALSSDGTVLAVGEEKNNSRGAVWIYDWSGSAWVQRGSILTPADLAYQDYFGNSVALNSAGDLLAVGSHWWEGAASAQGGVYLFTANGTGWDQDGDVLVANDAAAGDHFGSGVALSGDGTKLVIGAQDAEGSYSSQGQVYFFLAETAVDLVTFSLTPSVPVFPIQAESVNYGYETYVPLLVDAVWPNTLFLALSAAAPADAIQPDSVTAVLAVQSVEFPLQPDVIALEVIAPVPLVGGSYVRTTIDLRHVFYIPWVMPMTRPVYPPADTSLDLTPAVPDITIHGLWPPSELISGWAYDDGTDTVSFPLSSLAGLTAGQADAVTGDWRAVVLALCNTMWDAYVERETPLSALILDYNPGIVVPRGLLANTICAQHRATAYLNFPDKTITDEV